MLQMIINITIYEKAVYDLQQSAKVCWLMVLSNNLKCKNSGEGIAPYAENCRFSCGHCKKDPKGMKIDFNIDFQTAVIIKVKRPS